MLPRYSPIPDSDTEKQALMEQPVCHCNHQPERRQSSSKSNFFFLTVVVLLILGYGHHQNRSYQDPTLSTTELAQQDMNSPWTTTGYCGETSSYVPWTGKSVYNLDKNLTGIYVEEKYHHGVTNARSGKVVVVENKDLDTPKVTFDIKVESDDYQDSISIDQSVSSNTLELLVHHNANVGRPCVQVNAKVEVPSSSTLDDLSLKFPANDITISTLLQLKNSLDIDVASGDITVSKPLAATKIQLAAASGNINGVFNADQVDFEASAASGNLDIVFDHVSAVSHIKASSASGNVDVRLPSDFETKLDLNVVVGKVDLEAAQAEKLHYRRSGGIVGKTIRGYYGDDAETASRTKLSTVSGNLHLEFE